MPRKNARPAAKKARQKKLTRMQQGRRRNDPPRFIGVDYARTGSDMSAAMAFAFGGIRSIMRRKNRGGE